VFEEIVPALTGRCPEPEQFGRQTLERFRNPFLRHRLTDIALHHAAKKEIRLASTLRDYEQRFGAPPPLLAAALAGDRVAPAGR
jgi:tagaturonate reductase